jgi:putative transcriptional regulator
MTANSIKAIRVKLGLTQSALAAALECTQGNVGHYERGQTVPPDTAKRLIAFAKTKGHTVTYEDIYGKPWDGKERRHQGRK